MRDAGIDAPDRPPATRSDGSSSDVEPRDLDSGPPRAPDDASTDTPTDAPHEASPADDADAAHPVSEYCGDAIRDPITEECDDGTATDSCTADCRVRTERLIEAGRDDEVHLRGPRRRLGTGRHVIAAGSDGFAIVYTRNDTSRQVMLQRFDQWGTRSAAPVDVSAGSFNPAGDADPVVAALPGGRYAVAWSGHNPPRVVLHAVSSDGTVGEGQVVSAPTSGPKTQPDLLWTGAELVAAWTDGADVVRPDVKLRRFDSELAALDDEVPLDGGDLEGSPPGQGYAALAPFAGGWAAAWRAATADVEAVRVRAGEVSFQTEGYPPAMPGDRPALVELDQDRLLLVFTSRTAPGDGGAPGAQHLTAAVLDVTAPGAVASRPLSVVTEPYAGDSSLAQSRPDAVRVGDRIFLTWESESSAAGLLEQQVWLQELAWLPDEPDRIEIVDEWRLPVGGRSDPEQRRPALGASPLFPEGALIAAWEDHSGMSEDRPVPDLLLSFRPVPFIFLDDAGAFRPTI